VFLVKSLTLIVTWKRGAEKGGGGNPRRRGPARAEFFASAPRHRSSRNRFSGRNRETIPGGGGDGGGTRCCCEATMKLSSSAAIVSNWNGAPRRAPSLLLIPSLEVASITRGVYVRVVAITTTNILITSSSRISREASARVPRNLAGGEGSWQRQTFLRAARIIVRRTMP